MPAAPRRRAVSADEREAARDAAQAAQAAQVEGAIDAVEQMMEVLDGFEQYVVYAADRDQHGTRYRLNLLWIHAFAALLVAPALSLTGRDGMTGPSFAFLRTLPGTPYSLSTVIGLGGLILGMGCVFRHKIIEQVGLSLLFLFYLCMTISLAVPALDWLVHGGPVKPPMYGPVIYLHLTVIMAVHVWALMIRVRDERAATRALLAATRGEDLP